MTEPIDKIKTEAYHSGFKTGVCTGELKAIARIKKGVDEYIDGHKELEQYKNDLLNIVKGVKQ